METIEKTINYDEKFFKAEKDYGMLESHPTLGYTKAENVLGWIAEAIARRDKCVQFFGSFESHVWEVVDRIIMSEYKGGGSINVRKLYESVEEVAKIWEQVKYLSNIGDDEPSMGGGLTTKKQYERKGLEFIKCQSEVETLIGVGRLLEDYKDGDSDCYETAGGYRGWRALKGTRVEYHLNKDLTIRLEFESNCEVDHYNNNFFGKSTGNGTTEYKVGERVEKRSVTLGREAIDRTWKNVEIKAEIKKIDYDKMMALMEEYQPELVNAKKKRESKNK